MKNKKILITVIFSVICAAVILTVVLIGYYNKKPMPKVSADLDSAQSFDTLEEAVEAAGFSFKCSDRLNGALATDYSADQNSVIVTFGDAGYISKTLIMDEETSEEPVTTVGEDSKSYEINGISVLYIGDDVTVTQAEWTDNGFDYVISLGEQGVSPSVMTDYVLATR